MKILRGRTAFVTGAASGIGRTIAVALAREGVDLVITDIDSARLAQAEQEMKQLGVKVTSIICDLTRPEEISGMLDGLFAGGPLHILVNCAGVALYGQQRNIADADWRRLMAINLLAPIQITTRLINKLAEAEEAHVVNMSSVFGLIPFRGLAAYQSSKYGLLGFTLAVRNEYYRKNFGFSVVCPGFVKTPMLESSGPSRILSKPPKIPGWLYTTPEHVADATINAIKRDRGLVMVTLLSHVMWRFNRLFPGLVDFLNREAWRPRGPIVPPGEN